MNDFTFLADTLPQIVWTSDASGNLDYFNKNWYAYTGMSYEESRDLGIHKIIHPEEKDKTVRQWQKSYMEGANFEMEYRLRNREGKYHWFLVRAIPLRNERGDIEKWFGTCTDIHEVKQLQERLREQNRQLMQTNDDLDNFVYTASHDLKSPISNVEGLLHAMEEEITAKNSPEIVDYFLMINSSVDKLKQTIAELSQIGYIQKGGSADIEPVNIRDIIEEFKNLHSAEIKSSEARIVCNLETEMIRFPRYNFKLLMENLLSNALKFRSPERRPEVIIRTEKKENEIVLEILDNGIGINQQFADKLFRMYTRLHSHVPGSGIGLYMVKRIVQNWGGEVAVQSDPGKGTRFIIHLPQ